jgi:hypothetical protein
MRIKGELSKFYSCLVPLFHFINMRERSNKYMAKQLNVNLKVSADIAAA